MISEQHSIFASFGLFLFIDYQSQTLSVYIRIPKIVSVNPSIRESIDHLIKPLNSIAMRKFALAFRMN